MTEGGIMIQSQVLFYGGLIVMGASVVLALVSLLIFRITGKRIKKKLEQEYGNPADFHQAQKR